MTLADDPPVNRLLAALPPEDYAVLAPHLRVVRLRRGEPLFEAGGEVGHAWFPHDSVVSLVSLLEDGKTAETGTVGREGVAGFLSTLGGREALVHGIVQVAGGASRIDHARLHDAFEASRAVRHLLLRFAGAQVAQALQTVACNAHHPVEARLARWLLAMWDRVRRDELRLTHEFLAGMLGARRSTVSEAVGALKAAGLIAARPGALVILDRPGLERAACECYAIVRAQFERLLPGAFG